MKTISVIRGMTLALLLPTLLQGQNPLSSATAPPPSFTTVQITGLVGCPAAGFQAVTWSTGDNATTVSETLAVSKLFDTCSVPLFELVVLGKPISALLLTEHNGQTGTPLMSLKLEKAVAINYQLVGDQSTASPSEQLTFDYARITITDLINGVHFCYDKTQRKMC